jgi:uncharacterized protein YehS (DUF1456 family)
VLNNNDIMKKLRIALHLKDTDIMEILKLAEFEVSPSELSAIFRNEDHQNYRPCGDQMLRRFLDGLIIRNRGALAPKKKEVPKPAPEMWKRTGDSWERKKKS